MNHSAHLLRTRRLLAVAFFFLFPVCGQVGAQNLLFNYAKAHENDRSRGTTWVHADLAQMGVGGVNSWGAWPLPEYLLPTQPRTFRLLIRPVAN